MISFFFHSKPNNGVSRVNVIKNVMASCSERNKQHIDDKITFQSLENFPATGFHDAP